jgi:hypothetical protein
MLDTKPAAEPPDVLPWEGETTVTSSIHIIATEPTVEFNSYIYPSLIFRERAGYVSETRLDISLNGNAEHRASFAASLRAAADSIEAWTEPDGKFVAEDA